MVLQLDFTADISDHRLSKVIYNCNKPSSLLATVNDGQITIICRHFIFIQAISFFINF